MSKKVVALLPMKANSDRVTGKNFRLLAGKPLYQWILHALLAVDEIEEIVINTDARAILCDNGIPQDNRIVVRDRKAELCGDLVSMNKIIADDIEAISAETYIMTHTTNPFITAATIKAGLDKYWSNEESDSLFTVNKVQTRFYRKDGSAVNHNVNNLIRTQDLEPWFEENSCLYYFSKNSFASTQARIGKSAQMMETPPLESIDIDELHDWQLAAALAEYKANHV